MHYISAASCLLLPMLMSCYHIKDGSMNISVDKGVSREFVKANLKSILEKEFAKRAPINVHLFFYSHYLGLHIARPLPLQTEHRKEGIFTIEGTAYIDYLYEGNIFFYHTVSPHNNIFTYTITGQEQATTPSKPAPISRSKK